MSIKDSKMEINESTKITISIKMLITFIGVVFFLITIAFGWMQLQMNDLKTSNKLKESRIFIIKSENIPDLDKRLSNVEVIIFRVVPKDAPKLPGQ